MWEIPSQAVLEYCCPCSSVAPLLQVPLAAWQSPPAHPPRRPLPLFIALSSCTCCSVLSPGHEVSGTVSRLLVLLVLPLRVGFPRVRWGLGLCAHLEGESVSTSCSPCSSPPPRSWGVQCRARPPGLVMSCVHVTRGLFPGPVTKASGSLARPWLCGCRFQLPSVSVVLGEL